jgi:hypothetical protein
MRRFRSLAKRLQSDKDLLQSYQSVVRKQEESGVIERVPEEELNGMGTVHYLPHHPVIRTSSATTKVRVVYDASAKARPNDVSLNECMLKGPTILPDLCHLLIRFRTQPIAIVSDVEKAFLQVGLQPAERDVTRFFWFNNDSCPTFADSNVAVYRFCRVLFGVISSPFLLGATIQHHLALQGTDEAKALAKDIYVDNVISGVATETQGRTYYHMVKEIFRKAGMNLQQFYSNSEAVMNVIPEADKVTEKVTKILGLRWNGKSDMVTIGKPVA